MELRQGAQRMLMDYTPAGEWSGVRWIGGNGKYEQATFSLDKYGQIIDIRWVEAGRRQKRLHIVRDTQGSIAKITPGKQTTVMKLLVLMSAIESMYPLDGVLNGSDLSEFDQGFD